jgi:hypothetical protein
MKSSNRFLLGFGIGVVMLIALTVTLVLFTRNTITALPKNTPDGVVQRFLQAVQDEDYQTAYSYMNVVEYNVPLTYQNWLPDVQRPYTIVQSSWRATLGQATIKNDTAVIEVVIDVFQAGGPFENPVRSQTIAFNLTKIDGTWFITTRSSIWWLWY